MALSRKFMLAWLMVVVVALFLLTGLVNAVDSVSSLPDALEEAINIPAGCERGGECLECSDMSWQGLLGPLFVSRRTEMLTDARMSELNWTL